MLSRMSEKMSPGMEVPSPCSRGGCRQSVIRITERLFAFAQGTGLEGSQQPRNKICQRRRYRVPGISRRAQASFILTGFAVPPWHVWRDSLENPGLHEAGATERCATQAERVGNMDPRGCFLRGQRTRRLRFGRGAAPAGEA